MNKYISMDDYLMGRIKFTELSTEQVSNVNTLIPKINELLERFGEFRKCNSGFRTLEDQKRINPKATHSNHLTASAIDLEDKNRKLSQWCLKNLKVLEELGLWCEDFNTTTTWVHFQIIPPKSGHRVFIP